jgi:diaphanous 1
MRQLPPDRKRFLLSQHREASAHNPSPLRPSKTGPDVNNDGGALAGLKRFSLVGWGASSIDSHSLPPISSQPVTSYEGTPSTPTSPSSVTSIISHLPPSPHFAEQPQGATSWTSWWSAASNATGTGHAVGEQTKDTPQFYVDQLRSTYVQLSIVYGERY